MNSKTKTLIKTFVLEYLKLRDADFKIIGKKKLFECPFKHTHETESDQPSCNIFPPDSYNLHCFDPACGKIGNIFDLVRKVESNMSELSDDEIGEYLVKILDIKTDNKMDQLLAMYSDAGFCLFPLAKNSKNPVQGLTGWQKTAYRDIRQWQDWIKSGNGLALNLGAKSNAVALDIDDAKTYEKVKHLLGTTLEQKTKRGDHYVYSYDTDFDHINHANLRKHGYEMELRANNAYIAIAPTSASGETRTWNNEKIQPMPKELKDFLLSLIEKPKKEELKEVLKDEIIKIDGAIEEGRRDDTLAQITGVFRKTCNKETVLNIVSFINNSFCKPPCDFRQVKKIVESVYKYTACDKEHLSKRILNHLTKVEMATSRDLRDSLKFDKEDIEDALFELMKEEKVYRTRSLYKIMQKAEWKERFVDESRLIDFKMPYFDDYAVFRRGDMIVIGAKPGIGKSHIAVNFMKKIVDQGKKPNYISLEAGNRFSQIAITLGLKEGDFKWCNHYSPETIELEDEAITIIDWLLPDNYAETDKLYKKFTEQLDKHGGILIVFVQLTKDGGWFAPNMIDMFPAFAVKYEYVNGDSEVTCFKSSKARESKIGKQYFTIATKYDRVTKLLELR